jgi:hypothetical protein
VVSFLLGILLFVVALAALSLVRVRSGGCGATAGTCCRDEGRRARCVRWDARRNTG